VAATLVPTITVGAVAVWIAVDGYRTAFKDRLHDTTSALALAIDAEIDTYRAALATLAGSALLDAPEPDLITFRREAERAATTLGTTVALIDPTSLRQVINTALAPGSETGRTARHEFQSVARTGRPMVTDLAIGHVAGRPVASVAVPVHRDGAVRHVLIARLEPARLSELLASQARGSGAFATLVDGNNVIVARSHDHQRFVGQKLLDWAVELSHGQEAGLLRGKNRLGEEAISGFRRLPGAPGWMVVFGYPIAAYNDALWPPTAALVSGSVFALTLALLVAYTLSRRILRPVGALTRQAEAVAAGSGQELADRVPLAPVAEFERLRNATLVAEQTLRQRAAQTAAAEARLRAVVETAADAIIVIDEEGTMQSFNRAAEAVFGFAAREAVGQNVSMIMRSGEAARHDGHLAAYLRTGVAGIIGTGREVTGQRKDGATVPVDLAIAEWRDADGRRFFTGIMRDISARKAEDARKLHLMREVDHRAKNALAVVQSVVRLTPADEPRAFVAAVQARVAALARAHSLLAEEGWMAAELRTLLERELAPLTSSGRGAPAGAMRLTGPSIPLSPTVVQPFVMVLHELASNAAKHGALSRPGGQVEVSWQIGSQSGGDGILHLRWAEHGGPPVSGPPSRRGLGTRVIEATLRGQLGGSVEWRWEADGLILSVALPLARLLAASKDTNETGARTAKVAQPVS
jgi:PAS domain S-box-containing protein